MSTWVRRRTAALVLVGLGGLGLTGCVDLPSSGSVTSVNVQDTGDGETLVDYTPAGPRRGSAPVPLVQSFLTSMTATPLTTSVARQFLTPEAARSWQPEQGTVSYGSAQLSRGADGRVRLLLRDVTELDARGTWLGDPTGGSGHDYALRLVRVGGQWRIARLPDRLLVPRAHFESQYQQLLLYYFDRSTRVLVPEPVFLPRGRQAATLLVSGLLKGPEPYLEGTEQTFFPRGTALDGLSVPVSRAGTAEVPLSGQVLEATPGRRSRLLAQLSWTLGQIPGVTRLRVTVDGAPLDLPGSRDELSVDDSSQYDPAVTYAAASPFALRAGRVVTLDDTGEEPISGPSGSLRLGLRSLAVDLLAQHVAGVTADGRSLLESDRDGVAGRSPRRSDVRPLLTGATSLAPPVYDLDDQLWVLDRTRSGARLSVIRSGTARTVRVPGVTGATVSQLLVSRDGSRLAAQVRRGGRDLVVVSRVERDPEGRVLRVGAARRVAIGPGRGRVRDIAWRSPTGIAVLRTFRGSSQVVVAEVDGSPVSDAATDIDPFGRVADRLVSSPDGRSPLLVGTPDGRYYRLAGDGSWRPSGLAVGLRALTYVG